MTTITVEEAQAMLPELIDQLVPGGELLITRNAHAVARLVPADNEPPHPSLRARTGKGRRRIG